MTVTLGVAIAIPEPHATVLNRWRRRVGDAQADLIWPHVTLLPPTPVATHRLGLIEEHLAAAAASRSPFVMHRHVPSGVAGGVHPGGARAV
jgi:2'-5' RNA ligase